MLLQRIQNLAIVELNVDFKNWTGTKPIHTNTIVVRRDAIEQGLC